MFYSTLVLADRRKADHVPSAGVAKSPSRLTHAKWLLWGCQQHQSCSSPLWELRSHWLVENHMEQYERFHSLQKGKENFHRGYSEYD